MSPNKTHHNNKYILLTYEQLKCFLLDSVTVVIYSKSDPHPAVSNL